MYIWDYLNLSTLELKREKTGGRKKGTPNKVTKELRAIVKSVLDSEFQHLPKRLENLPDKERVDALIKLLPYVLPKYKQEEKEEPISTLDIPVGAWIDRIEWVSSEKSE